jgi:hypothetical protein
MKPDLFSELIKIRNEIAHGAATPEPAALAKRLADLGYSVPAKDLADLIPILLRNFGSHAGMQHAPPLVLESVAQLLEGRTARTVCDPCAGLGAVMATARAATRASEALAFTRRKEEAALGRVFAGTAEWQVGEPLRLLSALQAEVDVFASILPFGAESNEPLSLTTAAGETIELRDDLGNMILAAAATRLSADGIGLFVIPPSFFFSERSVLREFTPLGLGLKAALALPSGTFAPYTNIPTYLVVVQKQPSTRMFVAQLSNDATTNRQILTNLKQGKEGGSIDLGRFVDTLSFTGLDSIRIAERFEKAKQKFAAPAVKLEELATAITLGRHSSDFEFPIHDNAIFIPIIGISDVVYSPDDMTLKRQNYAQVAIDPARSNAGFVARFLNTDFGRELRELNKSGALIPKLNKQTLKALRIFVPDLVKQNLMLDIEARIAALQNTVLGLQAELTELSRELWTDPGSSHDVERRLGSLSNRLSGGLKQHAIDRLDQWFETLPFPIASILRAWQATPSQDFKAKYEHLLHFFEATAEFLSVIMLSAFSANKALFEPHKQKLAESMQKQNLSFQRATFGAWKLVDEYLGKQIRQLLGGDKDGRALCGNIFSDPSLALPEALSRKELATVLSTTNKMRNDWSGHGGVVGPEEARLRNERLLSEVQKLREVIADTWSETQLIHALNCRPRRGMFENEIAILMGSNSEFLKETRPMSTWLDVEQLYLARKDGGRALRLLPLVKVGPSPQSAKNACYFFNRLEPDGARFVSYHFTDRPELREEFDEATETIRLLAEI